MDPNQSFAELFNSFRNKANFSTYTQFGQALAAEGFVFEDSIFSKWKQGKRIPRDRAIVLALIKVFVKYKAITHLDDANLLLASVDQRDLNHREQQDIIGGLVSKKNNYSYYSHTIEPSIMHQPLDMLAHSLYVLNLQDISYPLARNYWHYQSLCAVSENYSTLNENYVSSADVFKMQVDDDYDKFGYGMTFVVISKDSSTGKEYLAATARFITGKKFVTSSLDLMNYIGVKDVWPHVSSNCAIEHIAELDRLVLANWVWPWRHQILRELLQCIAQYAKRYQIEYLYNVTSPFLCSLYNELNIITEEIEDAYFLGEVSDAERLYPIAHFEKHNMPAWWNLYTKVHRLIL